MLKLELTVEELQHTESELHADLARAFTEGRQARKTVSQLQVRLQDYCVLQVLPRLSAVSCEQQAAWGSPCSQFSPTLHAFASQHTHTTARPDQLVTGS